MKHTTETFIENAIKIHGNKYDYSLVNYIRNNVKVNIICPIHGVFSQTYKDHITKEYDCPSCKKNNKIIKEHFLEKTKIIHGNKYDYSNIDYIDYKTPIFINCKIHGDFKCIPNAHINKKQGCPKCKNLLNNEIFIKRSNIKHKNKYDYNLVDYKGVFNKVKIICPVHGIFEQIAYNHMNGQGCPKCKESKGEKNISYFLNKNNIKYIRQKKFDKCINKYPLSFDFYLPDYNICIEFNGSQHYTVIKYWGGEVGLQKRILRDNIKIKYCIENNIKLIIIKDKENILEKLSFLLKNDNLNE